MNKNIYLNHSICKKLLKLSENGLYTYFVLKSIYNQNYEELLIDYNQLTYIFNNRLKATSNDINNFKNGIIELCNNNFIEITQTNNKGEPCVLNLQNLKHNDKKNVSEQSDYSKFEVDNLSNCIKDCRGRKTILKFLIYILDKKYENLFNGKEMFYVPISIDEIEKDLKYNKKTIICYNKILEDNKIIYIYRSNDTKSKNKYMRYSDKNKFLNKGE